MQTGVDASVLRSVPLFDGLKEKELEDIAKAFRQVYFALGDVILRQGDPGDSLYAILDGKVQVGLSDKPLARLGPGQFFGELGAVRFHDTRSVDVMATEPCKCIVSSPGAFPRLVERYPVLSGRIMSTIKRRYEQEAGSGSAPW